MNAKSPSESDLLTMNQAAAYLKVHRNTLAKWRDARSVPFIALPNGMTRFSRRRLDEWLEARSRSGKR